MAAAAPETNDIAIIGAGLVGTATAIYLAKLGFNVHLYEARADLRLEISHDDGRYGVDSIHPCVVPTSLSWSSANGRVPLWVRACWVVVCV